MQGYTLLISSLLSSLTLTACAGDAGLTVQGSVEAHLFDGTSTGFDFPVDMRTGSRVRLDGPTGGTGDFTGTCTVQRVGEGALGSSPPASVS